MCVCVCVCVFVLYTLSVNVISAYLGADSRMYRSADLPMIIRLISGCTESENHNSSHSHSLCHLVASCRDAAESQHPVMELLTTVGGSIITALMEMGFENAMIVSGLGVIQGIAVSLPAYELLQVLSLDCIQQLFRLMTGSAGEGVYQHVVSRLTPETLSKLWEVTGLLASRLAVCASAVAGMHVAGCNDTEHLMLEALPLPVADIIAIFGQVCDHLCTELAVITTDAQKDSSSLSVAIAFLRGAARWVLTVSEGDWGDGDLVQIDTYQGTSAESLQRQHTINQLLSERQERIRGTSGVQQRQLYNGVFNAALPFLMSRISTMTLHESDTQLLLLTEIFQLIVDYTECQFVNLPKNGVTTLYEVTLGAMMAFVKRQMAERPEGSERTYETPCVSAFLLWVYVVI